MFYKCYHYYYYYLNCFCSFLLLFLTRKGGNHGLSGNGIKNIKKIEDGIVDNYLMVLKVLKFLAALVLHYVSWLLMIIEEDDSEKGKEKIFEFLLLIQNNIKYLF